MLAMFFPPPVTTLIYDDRRNAATTILSSGRSFQTVNKLNICMFECLHCWQSNCLLHIHAFGGTKAEAGSYMWFMRTITCASDTHKAYLRVVEPWFVEAANPARPITISSLSKCQPATAATYHVYRSSLWLTRLFESVGTMGCACLGVRVEAVLWFIRSSEATSYEGQSFLYRAQSLCPSELKGNVERVPLPKPTRTSSLWSC